MVPRTGESSRAGYLNIGLRFVLGAHTLNRDRNVSVAFQNER